MSATSAGHIYRQCCNSVLWKVSFMQSSELPGSVSESYLHLSYDAVRTNIQSICPWLLFHSEAACLRYRG